MHCGVRCVQVSISSIGSITSSWSVKITGAVTQFDPKPYVAYRLKVSTGQCMWRLVKRYNRFVELHNAVRFHPLLSVREREASRVMFRVVFVSFLYLTVGQEKDRKLRCGGTYLANNSLDVPVTVSVFLVCSSPRSICLVTSMQRSFSTANRSCKSMPLSLLYPFSTPHSRLLCADIWTC
jgi:hypothetical protein